MFTRFCNHLSKMWKPTPIDLVPLRPLSKFSACILVFLLAFSMPVGAVLKNSGQPPQPSSQSGQPTSPDQQQTNDSNPTRGTRSEPGNKNTRTEAPNETSSTEVQINNTKQKMSSPGGQNSKSGKSTAKADEQKTFPERIVSKIWFLYAIAAGLVLNFLCLIALTWWTYQGLVTLKRKNERFTSDFSKTKTALQQLTGQVNNQAQSLINAKSDTSELHNKLTSHGKKISNLNTQIELQDNRFLRFQDIYNTSRLDYLPKSRPDAPLNQQKSLTSGEKPLVDPAESIAVDYQDAFYRSDRSVLKRLMSEELNITQDSEDALMKSSSLPTKLEVVKTGGSYLLIQRDGRHWLVPEFQILTSFTTSQLAKGIFSYAKENISTAELRRPAEVRELGSLWEVVTMGVIAVPA